MQNKELHFRNGRFRILQIADTQEVSDINPDTLKLMAAAIDVSKPDLIVLTGDQIKGYSVELMQGNSKEKVRKLLTSLLKPITDRGIPFTATFGNHDEECGVSKEDQMEIYKSLPGFVYGDPANENECGTFVLSIDDESLIWIFDSHRKDGHGGAGTVHEDQLKWYRETRDAYEKKYGIALPGYAFQHIPTPEYYDVIKKVSPFSRNRVRAYGPHKNTWYALDPNNSEIGDFMKEPPSPPHINVGEVDAFLEKKDVRALFVGHNHNTSFTAKYKDIYLSITQGCGFNVYGPGLDRGVRYIDIYDNGTFESHTITFKDICGKEIERKLTYAKQAVAPVSIAGTKTAIVETAATAAVVGGVIGLVKLATKKKKTK